jgi:hypothetical protein
MNTDKTYPPMVRDFVGPFIPFDLKVIAKMPLRVKRAFLPEPDPFAVWLDDLDKLAELNGLDLVGWHRKDDDGVRHATYTLGKNTTIDCQSCDGDGEFEHYGHYYECKKCDGEGYIEGEDNLQAIAEVNINTGVVSFEVL